MTKPIPKHLKRPDWPSLDAVLFEAAFRPGDIFDDDRPPGAHLAERTRRSIESGYGRWLSFLMKEHLCELDRHPVERIRPGLIRRYIEGLDQQMRPTSVAAMIHFLRLAAGLIAPERDWSWLRNLQRRLNARSRPVNRLHRLSSPWALLELGLSMMEEARSGDADPWMLREVTYRNGLIIALLALWPIRRRSLAALTISRHLEIDGDQIRLRLFADDTKAKRAEVFTVPDVLVPALTHYLSAVRPALLRGGDCEALWVSRQARAFGEQAIYEMIITTTKARLGKAMGVHDFRRSAATFTAIDAPEMIGILPGVLQHATPEVSERHYNLAQSASASRRHGGVMAELRRQALKSRSIKEC